VNFTKSSCPICLPLEPSLEQVAEEYEGRAKVVKFEIMTWYSTITSPEIRNRYGIALVPTVLLFNKGVEVKRWAVVYHAGPYREGLDKVLGAAAEGAGSGPAGAESPAVSGPPLGT
jgi:thioredoxin-like negative regulator of GroEL